jgi:hypothetical protein
VVDGVEVTVLVKEIVAVIDGPAPAPTRSKQDEKLALADVVTPT